MLFNVDPVEARPDLVAVVVGVIRGGRQGLRVPPVGEGVVGRVVNTLGQPIDGKGAIEGDLNEMPLERKAPGVVFRQPVNEPLQTGIKSIDAMIPVGRGSS